ncbi:MAG: GrpB family protein [Patescibacteria group bacterium]
MTSLGLKKGTVKVLPHQTTWHSNFEKQKEQILGLKNKHICAVEHVGSTSVLGMPAKPIVDIIVGVDKYCNKGKLIKDLACIGFEFRFEPRKYQSLFVKTNSGRETHYLKVLRYKGNWWNQYLVFKDVLMNDKKFFERYRKLKLKSRQEFVDNRKAYTRSKSELIARILGV